MLPTLLYSTILHCLLLLYNTLFCSVLPPATYTNETAVVSTVCRELEIPSLLKQVEYVPLLGWSILATTTGHYTNLHWSSVCVMSVCAHTLLVLAVLSPPPAQLCVTTTHLLQALVCTACLCYINNKQT
jgi:hypothetical protein